MDYPIIVYVIAIIISLAAGYVITNFYHQINKRVSIAQSQLFLLCKIAEKAGIEKEYIHKAYNHSIKALTDEDVLKQADFE